MEKKTPGEEDKNHRSRRDDRQKNRHSVVNTDQSATLATMGYCW